MSLSNKNRVYGLIFGGILSDIMGALVSYNPNIKITKPSDSQLVNIKEGYWTEPTTLWFNTFSPEKDHFGLLLFMGNLLELIME